MHYNPKDGVYVFFRYTETDKVMVILSKNKTNQLLTLSRFNEILPEGMEGVDIISGKKKVLSGTLEVAAMSAMIIDLD